MGARHIVGIAFATALASASAGAASQTDTPAGQAARIEPQRDDIIVTGLKNRMKLPTRTFVPGRVDIVKSRQRYEFSDRLAGCATRSRLGDLSMLRAVVDGEFNSARQAAAQDRLKRLYITCTQSVDLLTARFPDGQDTAPSDAPGGTSESLAISELTDVAPLGRSIYDRGAFMIRAMRMYAPDLSLTTDETSDPDVQRRFMLREMPRNRYRLPLDYDYLRVAVCMTQLQPGLAVQLVMDDANPKLDGIQATLINRARRCVGNARNVSVDPVQFRIYIADAVYRWAVAARNVASLIPERKS